MQLGEFRSCRERMQPRVLHQNNAGPWCNVYTLNLNVLGAAYVTPARGFGNTCSTYPID